MHEKLLIKYQKFVHPVSKTLDYKFELLDEGTKLKCIDGIADAKLALPLMSDILNLQNYLNSYSEFKVGFGEERITPDEIRYKLINKQQYKLIDEFASLFKPF